MLMTMLAALATAPQIPPCTAARIALSIDGRDGDFNGMSHSGTLLVLRNRGAACRIEALPRVSFTRAGGRALPIVRNVPPGMHPGPVMVPLVIPAGGVVSTPLRWIPGEVFDSSRCFSPVRVSVRIGGTPAWTRIGAHICGPMGKPAGFDQPPLRPGTATSAPG